MGSLQVITLAVWVGGQLSSQNGTWHMKKQRTSTRSLLSVFTGLLGIIGHRMDGGGAPVPPTVLVPHHCDVIWRTHCVDMIAQTHRAYDRMCICMTVWTSSMFRCYYCFITATSKSGGQYKTLLAFIKRNDWTLSVTIWSKRSCRCVL